MWIEQAAGQAERRQGQPFEEATYRAFRVIEIAHEALFSEVVFIILDQLFVTPETALEPAQARVGKRSAPQMQKIEAVSSEMPYGFPHHQVIGAQPLKRVIGGAEFENRLLPMMEKDSSRDALGAAKSRDDYAMMVCKHMPDDVLEKTKRLRREAVPSASKAMQGIVPQHGFQIGPELDSQFRHLRFSDASSSGTFQLLEQALAPMLEMDDVPIKT